MRERRPYQVLMPRSVATHYILALVADKNGYQDLRDLFLQKVSDIIKDRRAGRSS